MFGFTKKKQCACEVLKIANNWNSTIQKEIICDNFVESTQWPIKGYEMWSIIQHSAVTMVHSIYPEQCHFKNSPKKNSKSCVCPCSKISRQ